MKIFLTGASGYIGSAVARALVQHGHSLIALTRSAESETKLSTLSSAMDCEFVRGDVLNASSIRRGAEKADGVIHTASPGNETYAAADDNVIRTVIDTLAGSGRPFVYTSGIAVHGSTGGKIIDETAPYDPSPVVAFRVDCERRVKAAAELGIRSVVVSPAFVYGRAGGIAALWFESARDFGIVRYVGDGTNRWTTVHVDDLGDLYLRAVTSAPAGSAYFGASGAAVRVHDAALAASEGAGVPGEVESTPYETARQSIGPLADLLVLDQQASGQKAQRELGWQPTAPDLLTELRTGSYAKRRSSAGRA
jgi:nucleoside-diphosphate-sugar epimerase